MRLVVDATAARDHDDIGTWIARDNPAAAERILRHVLQTLAELQHLPRLARRGRVRGTYERVVTGTPYIIVFELWEAPAAIIVTAVVHGARDR